MATFPQVAEVLKSVFNPNNGFNLTVALLGRMLSLALAPDGILRPAVLLKTK